MISGGLLEMQTGSDFENKATNVKWTDYLTVTSNAAETSWKAVGTTGNEIEAVYIRNGDGTLGKKLVQDSAVSAGKFTYAPDTKKLAFNASEVADGTEIVVFYDRKIVADTLTNLSDTYSGKCSLYVDAIAENKCAEIFRIQFYIPKADFNGEFSLEFGENQSVHAFEAEALSGACGTAGMFFTYTVFGADTKDAD